MKTLLATPIRPRRLQSWVLPPLGLGYLAQAMRNAGHEVEILDCARDRLPWHSFGDVVGRSGARIVGISLYTQDARAGAKMAEIVRTASPPGTVVVIGGPYVAADPAESLRMICEADYGFAGEAEDGLVRLAGLLEQGAPTPAELSVIPNIAFRCDGDVVRGPRQFADVDQVPIPAWDLLYRDPYPRTPPTIICEHTDFAPVVITRGCPYACAYCAGDQVHGKRVRRRDPCNVIEEFDLLRRRFGKREYHIMDDNFTMDRAYVIELCRRIVERGWDVSFASPNGVHLNTLDAEMLSWMKRAGWYLLCVGIESGSDRVLREMRKGITVALVREKVALVRQAGIEVYGFFILGYPTETIEEMKQTIALSLDMDLVGAGFSCFQPFPGTPLYQSLVASGEISPGGSGEGTYADVAYSPCGMTKRDMKILHHRAVVRFYTRPRVLAKILSHVRSAEHLLSLVKRGSDYVF